VSALTRHRSRRQRALVGALLLLIAIVPSAAARLGADLSILPRNLYSGAVYRDGAGQAVEPLSFLRQNGLELVRLRLWHSPAEPWHGLDSTLAFAQRVTAGGAQLVLDLHYSDTWADPAHQQKPAAWAGLTFVELTDSVYQYSVNVARRFHDAGVPLYAVQIGNEISGGLLWNDGRVGGEFDTPQHWNQLAALIISAVSGVRSAIPQAEWPLIILHLDGGGDNATARWWFDNLQARHVDFNVIGLSYYPWWQGSFAALGANCTDLAARYRKPIWVVETAYPFTLSWNDDTANIVGDSAQLDTSFAASPDGQAAFVDSVLAVVRGANQGVDTPVCYWEPAWIPADSFGSPWENLAWFDFAGQALPVVDLLHASAAPRERVYPASTTLRIWPNPLTAGDPLFIDNSDRSVNFVLFNILGRRVAVSSVTTSGRAVINTSGLPAGLYFIRHSNPVASSAATIRILR
jgi:arabinogalactan endo-1,4-beta-galactosidase